MDNFIREYLRLRDGNKSPVESRRERCTPKKPPFFETTIVTCIERLTMDDWYKAMLEAVGSGAVHAIFRFRYESREGVFVSCNQLLDRFFLPLKQRGVIGTAAPLWQKEPLAGQWVAELFPIEAVPQHEQVTLTPEGIRDLLMLGITRKPPPGATVH